MLSITEFAIVDALYQGERIAVPTPPSALSDLPIRQLSDTIFASAPLEGVTADLYASRAFLKAVLGRELPERLVAYGFAGHGLVSQAIHYYVTTPEVVVLLQVSWGGYSGEMPAQRQYYTALQRSTVELVDLASASAADGTFPPDRRLVVVIGIGGLSQTGWAPRTPIDPESEDIWSSPASATLLQNAIEQVLEFMPKV